MKFEEYAAHDGLGLAALVKSGEVTAAELLEVAIARMESENPKLNAVVIPMIEEARRISHDDPLIVGDLGWCFATAGRTEDARAMLADLGVRTATEWVSPVALARIHIGLGENDEALAELERAYETRAYRIVTLDVETRWDPIRAEPRFRDLRQKVGLQDSASAVSI